MRYAIVISIHTVTASMKHMSSMAAPYLRHFPKCETHDYSIKRIIKWNIFIISVWKNATTPRLVAGWVHDGRHKKTIISQNLWSLRREAAFTRLKSQAKRCEIWLRPNWNRKTRPWANFLLPPPLFVCQIDLYIFIAIVLVNFRINCEKCRRWMQISREMLLLAEGMATGRSESLWILLKTMESLLEKIQTTSDFKQTEIMRSRFHWHCRYSRATLHFPGHTKNRKWINS